MKSIMLRIRVEPEFKEMLQKAVKEGKAESMSDLIRKAVKKMLENKGVDVRIACRIPIEDDKTIEKLVKEGKYINKSDFFRKAIKKLLENESEVRRS